MGTVKVHLTIHLRTAQWTFHVNESLGIAIEAEQLSWDKAVEDLHRQTSHLEGGVEVAITRIMVITLEQTKLHIVAHQSGFHSMHIIVFLHIDQLCTDIPHRQTLIGPVADRHIRDDRELFVVSLHHVVVAVEISSHAWHIRNDGGDIVKIKLMETHRKVLQECGVTVLGVDLHTRAIVGQQVYFRLYAVVLSQIEEVIGVKVEEFIADGRLFRNQVQTDTLCFQVGRGSQTQSHLVVGIEITHAECGSMLMQETVEEGVKHDLRIPFIVSHLSLEGQFGVLMLQRQVDGIDTDTVVIERMDIGIAIDTSFWRGGHVDVEVLEGDLRRTEEFYQGVVLTAAHIQMGSGQHTLQLGLVDDAFLPLSHRLVEPGSRLFEKLLVAALGRQLEGEVACHHLCPCGITTALHVEAPREVGHQWFVSQAQTVEVCFLHIGSDGGLDTLHRQKSIDKDGTFHQVVMTL